MIGDNIIVDYEAMTVLIMVVVKAAAFSSRWMVTQEMVNR